MTPPDRSLSVATRRRALTGRERETKYYLSNLPADAALTRMATNYHGHWPIEQFCKNAKGECGVGDYQGRRWDEVHRHLPPVMVTYSL